MSPKKPKKTTKLLKVVPLKLSIPICVVDMGDGSTGVFVYRTSEEAEKRAQQADAKDEVAEADTLNITVDEDGNIISGYTELDESENSKEEPDTESNW